MNFSFEYYFLYTVSLRGDVTRAHSSSRVAESREKCEAIRSPFHAFVIRRPVRTSTLLILNRGEEPAARDNTPAVTSPRAPLRRGGARLGAARELRPVRDDSSHPAQCGRSQGEGTQSPPPVITRTATPTPTPGGRGPPDHPTRDYVQ